MIEDPSIAIPAAEKNKDESESGEEERPESRIVTTQEEIEAYYIIKSILRSNIDTQRVVMRDTISYLLWDFIGW